MCESPSCPAIVRGDCIQRLDELEHAQSTIVFDVKDATGADVSAVTVTIDGAPFAERLEGGALRVDPGDHTFGFAAAGQEPVTRHVVIKEGVKDRHEPIVLPASQASPAVIRPAPPEPPPPEAHTGIATQRLLGIVVGAEGLAAVAVGGVFGALSLSAASQQKSDCASATSCSSRAQADSDHSTATTDGNVSTVAFVAGGVLLAGGALLFFTAPSSSPPADQRAGLLVAPSIGPGGAGLLLRGEFR
jgi:hypothetical protein